MISSNSELNWFIKYFFYKLYKIRKRNIQTLKIVYKKITIPKNNDKIYFLVRETGIEPVRVSPHAP